VDSRRSLVGGALNEGGNVVAWCREHLRLPDDDAELERAVAAAPAGVLDTLPFLAGERAPGWRGDARAALSGLTLATTAASVLRAFMEAVACRLALVYERLAPLASAGHRVIASGSALHHSATWAGIVADALGVPVTLSRARQASSRGAALRALAGLGAPAPPPLTEGATRHPDAGRHQLYRALGERQRDLYDKVVGDPPRLRQ
jgi:gluconokinase